MVVQRLLYDTTITLKRFIPTKPIFISIHQSYTISFEKDNSNKDIFTYLLPTFTCR